MKKFSFFLLLIAGIIAFSLFKSKINLENFLDDFKGEIVEKKTIVTEENAVIDTFEKSSPSVVAIGITRRVFNPFDPFSVPKKEDATIGTGFIVDSEGIIVTNKHVVLGGGPFTVVTKDDKKYEVKKIYRDPVFDLAIVKIDATNLPVLKLGDSSKLKAGQSVIAIGNALGKFTNTVTTGVVSGLSRNIVAGNPFGGFSEALDNLIQTDAAINPGNSGGPLLNLSGEVIGVNVAVSDGAENIGFAIPVNSVKQIVEEFIKNGSISRPFLGVRYKFIPKDLAILNDIPMGAYIQEVVEDSSAEKVGIKQGDIVTKIDNQTVDSEGKLGEIISKSKIGSKIDLEIFRDGEKKTLNVEIKEAPNESE